MVCVNKMDLVGWEEGRFEEIRDEFRNFATKLDVHDVTFVPHVGLARRQRGRPAATT